MVTPLTVTHYFWSSLICQERCWPKSLASLWAVADRSLPKVPPASSSLLPCAGYRWPICFDHKNGTTLGMIVWNMVISSIALKLNYKRPEGIPELSWEYIYISLFIYNCQRISSAVLWLVFFCVCHFKGPVLNKWAVNECALLLLVVIPSSGFEPVFGLGCGGSWVILTTCWITCLRPRWGVNETDAGESLYIVNIVIKNIFNNNILHILYMWLWISICIWFLLF